ncbi:MAG: carboxymuconolactone decarboxylase family protein [Acidobacteria bacterium]|nr:carboxymuconolactone decarboxylase family protein [Acidobacteriota bacterium]
MYDMKNLVQLKKLDANAPDGMKAFWAFDKVAFEPGAIDALHKQLMALAVALTTQCPYCLEIHRKAAVAAGATEAMIAETAVVAAAMRAGAAVTHASHLFK